MRYRARIKEEVTVEREVWIELDEDPRGKELTITRNLNPSYVQSLGNDVPIHEPILVEVMELQDLNIHSELNDDTYNANK